MIFLSLLLAVSIFLIIYLFSESILQFFEKILLKKEQKRSKNLLDFFSFSKKQQIFLFTLPPLLAAILPFFLLKEWKFQIAVAFLNFFIFRYAGFLFLKILKKREIKKMKEDFVQILQLMANSLRSGLSLFQSFEMSAQAIKGRLSKEIEKMLSEVKVGIGFDQAMKNFKERIELAEVERLIESLIILRESGGNLVQVFQSYFYTLKEEKKIQEKIKTLTTQGTAQAVVICLLPFVLATALYKITPAYITPLWTSWMGLGAIFLILFLQVCGALMMRKIIKIRI